ncbi:hypothetical protein [Nocardioides daphniae]|uniref:hypothetical protein n=1 Tax=Nocardioides daphniae TaxID=402297 RepID=UPI001E60C75F|nr:hypothetical protein [Nocardioides daphniae]
MEILWWLAPSVVVTCVAMAWIGWLGRDGRGEVDREVAAARLAKALERERAVPRTPPARERDRSTGIAVRPPREQGGSSASGPGSDERRPRAAR